MARRASISVLGLLALAPPAFARVTPHISEASRVCGETMAQLQPIIQAFLDAIARGDRAVWEKTFDDSLIYIDESGKVNDKAEMLAALQPLPPGSTGTIAITELQVACHGDFAIATHLDVETHDFYGQVLVSGFRATDTWKKVGGEWRMIAGQVLAILKDPPARPTPAAALAELPGRYRLTDEIALVVETVDGKLRATRTGRPAFELHTELPDVFFAPGQPRLRWVVLRDAAGKIEALAQRREGQDIVWKRQR